MNGQPGNTADPHAQGAAPPLPQVEGFTLLELLGTSSWGHTWHARTKAGQQVALKLFSARLTSQPGFLSRFDKVSAALLALHHTHIAETLERGRSGDQLYLATEFFPGGSLRKNPPALLDVPGRLRLALGVGRGLQHAHERGLVHRSLSPENIFVTASGLAKVTDFGVARLRYDDTAPPSPYCAPEQRTQLEFTEARADLYSLATVLYELLYRELPPSPWSAAASKVPVRDTQLFSLFSRGLAEDPLQRFRRVQDFADELEKMLEASQGAPSSAHQAAGPLAVEVRGRTLHVRVRTRGDAEAFKRSLGALEQVLRQPGPWAVAYDLSEMTGWSTRETEVLIALHRQHEKNLLRVGFCSPLPSVRGGGMLIGTALKDLPWLTFASAYAMRHWVEGEPPR